MRTLSLAVGADVVHTYLSAVITTTRISNRRPAVARAAHGSTETLSWHSVDWAERLATDVRAVCQGQWQRDRAGWVVRPKRCGRDSRAGAGNAAVEGSVGAEMGGWGRSTGDAGEEGVPMEGG